MRLGRLAAVTTAAVVAISGVTVSPSPAAASARPGVVVDYAYHKIKVKPSMVRPYKDVYFTKVHWTRLGSTTGTATAIQNVNTCLPDCATGRHKLTAVRLTFSRVRLSDCRKVFTRVKVTEVRSHRTRTYPLPVNKRSHCR